MKRNFFYFIKIFSFFLFFVLCPLGSIKASWIAQDSTGVLYWEGVASSSDGEKLVATVYKTNTGSITNYIYVSLDGGITWSAKTSAGARGWFSVASSADGSELVAGVWGGYIYISSDGGSTWSVKTSIGSRLWQSITMSSDGSKIIVAAYNGYIYISSDYGDTWTTQTSLGSKNWQSLVSDNSGQYLVASTDSGYIYTSSDYGATWVERISAGSRSWWGLSSSSDGSKIVASVYGGYIYTSSDYGITWVERTSAGSRNWKFTTSSADGNKIAVSVNNNYIYTSLDGGDTWVCQTSGGIHTWDSIKFSSSGDRLIALAYGNYVHVYTPSVPIVNSSLATSVDYHEVNLNGTIADTGGLDLDTKRGFEYGLTDSYGNVIEDTGSFNSGNFSMALSSLMSGTTYHYRAYAVNSMGTSYGQDKTVNTLNYAPSVSDVGISGSYYYGKILIGSYLYQDTENDLEGSSIYRWLRNDEPIEGANSLEYRTTKDDVNKIIKLEITPVALSGATTGQIVMSDGIVIKNSSKISGSSKSSLTSFYQEQYQRALATGVDTTPYTQALNNLNQLSQTPDNTTSDTTHRTLKLKMTGDDVKTLQVYLNNHNYPLSSTGVGSIGKETTYFGTLTKQAVIKFQLANSLVGDGIVGPKTWAKIDSIK